MARSEPNRVVERIHAAWTERVRGLQMEFEMKHDEKPTQIHLSQSDWDSVQRYYAGAIPCSGPPELMGMRVVVEPAGPVFVQ